MPQYVDGFVIPLPRKRLAPYKKIAAKAAKVWREYGALDYQECIMDTAPQPEGVPGDLFKKQAKTKPGETVVFAYIRYRSRASRPRQRQGPGRPAPRRDVRSQTDAVRHDSHDLRRLQRDRLRLSRPHPSAPAPSLPTLEPS